MNIEGEFVALDLETRDPHLKTLGPGWAFKDAGYPVGYAVSWWDSSGNQQARYLPVRHESGGNMPVEEVRSILAPVLSDPRRTIVTANGVYDYGWTLWDGFEWNAKIDDVQIQAPLIDDQRMTFGLDALAKEYLGEGKQEEGLLEAARRHGISPKDVKKMLWKLPGPDVAPYGEADAAVTLRLWDFLRNKIRELGLERVHNLECRLVPVIYQMRKRGVRVDLEKADQTREKLLAIEEVVKQRLSDLTPHSIEPWNTSSIVRALEAEGVAEFPLTEKRKQKSVNGEFLDMLSESDSTAGKIAKEVKQLRRYNKARSTFVENMVLGHAKGGRIHSELKALRSEDGGAVTGRFASSNPNLQQVPAKDPELGPLIRSLFLPEEGEQWCAIDYSSQEPRLAIHFGVKARARGAEKLAELFRKDPRTDPYLPTAELCGITRKDAKTIRLGILYGMGGGTLCEHLGLPWEWGTWNGRDVKYAGEEGKALINRFNENSPMDKELAKMATRKAEVAGEVRTLLGRRATFPVGPGGERWFTHKALNRVIQGSAADMTKTAMVNIYAREGRLPLVSVHDELGFSISSLEEGEMYEKYMAEAIPLEIPIVCDREVGESWGDSMGR